MRSMAALTRESNGGGYAESPGRGGVDGDPVEEGVQRAGRRRASQSHGGREVLSCEEQTVSRSAMGQRVVEGVFLGLAEETRGRRGPSWGPSLLSSMRRILAARR